MTGRLARTFGGEIPRVPGPTIKNTSLTVYIVLLGFSTGSLNRNKVWSSDEIQSKNREEWDGEYGAGQCCLTWRRILLLLWEASVARDQGFSLHRTKR